MRRSSTAIVLIVLFLAGCASPEEAPPADADVAAGDAPAPDGLVPARFADGPAVDATVWKNGTFKVQDAGRTPQGFAVAPPASGLVQVDVSDLVPVGVPAVLVGEVQATMSQGDVDVWYDVEDDEFRTGGGCAPRGGFSRVAPGIVHAAGTKVVLNLYYDEAEPAAEVPYTLFARVLADPTLVPGGMSVGLTVPPGTTSVDVEVVGEKRDCMFDLDTPNLMLWGADDAFAGHRALDEARTTVPLPDDAGGEVVLLLSQGGRGMRVHAPPGSTLRALGQEFVLSEPHKGGGADAVEWTTEVEKVPTLAGVFFFNPPVAKDVRVKYASPTTTFFEGTFEGGPWFNAEVPGVLGVDAAFWFDSAFGVPGLEAGTYTGSVRFGAGAGPTPVEAQDVAAYWIR